MKKRGDDFLHKWLSFQIRIGDDVSGLYITQKRAHDFKKLLYTVHSS